MGPFSGYPLEYTIHLSLNSNLYEFKIHYEPFNTECGHSSKCVHDKETVTDAADAVLDKIA